MAGSINKVILIGHLGQDPEVRHTQAGAPIVTLSVATSEKWKDRSSGEQKERTEWHRVVIFSEGLAKIAEQFLKKGSPVYLEGALQTRSWDDQAGSKRYTTEVVLQSYNSQLVLLGGQGGRPPPADGPDSYGARPGGTQSRQPPGNRPPPRDDMDDEIPF